MSIRRGGFQTRPVLFKMRIAAFAKGVYINTQKSPGRRNRGMLEKSSFYFDAAAFLLLTKA